MKGLIENRDLILPLIGSIWWLWVPFIGGLLYLRHVER